MPNAEGFRALIARLGDGTDDAEQAARQIIDQFGDHLRAAISRRLGHKLRSQFDCDDFMQSVWGSLVRLGPELKQVDDFDHLLALLITMAQNKVVKQYRVRTHGKDTSPIIPLQASNAVLEDPSKRLKPVCLPRASQFVVARERWSKMLDGESPLCKQVLTMRLAGHTNHAIAEKLNINIRSVRRILTRMRRLDAEKFGDAG